MDRGIRCPASPGARENHVFPPRRAPTPAKTRRLHPHPLPPNPNPPACRSPEPPIPAPRPLPLAAPLALFRPRAPSPNPQAAMDVNEEAMAAHKRAFLDFLDQDVSPLAVPSAAAGSPGTRLTFLPLIAGWEGGLHAGRPRHGPEQAPPPHHRHGRPPQPQPRSRPQVPRRCLPLTFSCASVVVLLGKFLPLWLIRSALACE